MTEVYNLDLDPKLNPTLLQCIRESTAQGIQEATQSTLFTVPGGRIPKADPDTLAALNAPCATCGHSYNSHAVEGKKCIFCTPKGSQHSYHETLQFAQNTVTGTGIREAEFSDEEQALIRLSESIWPSPDQEYTKLSDSDLKQSRAVRSRANLYNSHQLAAHRASAQAYQSGSESDHEVAAQHHEMAANAAKNAQQLHKPGSQNHKDYGTAHSYHNSQAKAHRDASRASATGNSIRHPMTPNYAY